MRLWLVYFSSFGHGSNVHKNNNNVSQEMSLMPKELKQLLHMMFNSIYTSP